MTTEQTPCINPATLEVLGHVEVNTREEVHTAVQAAREAQASWMALSVKERVGSIVKIRDYLVEIYRLQKQPRKAD